MRILNMRAAEKEGAIKAFFRVETEDGFLIDGFKVVEGKNGLFVSLPSKKVGEKFIETVTVPGELRDPLTRMALDEYRALAGSDRKSAPPRSPSGPPEGPDIPW
jgi:stage V sporulation protein G